jgi:hemerythrin-like domain-containing protein
MRPTDILESEHRIIEQVLSCLEKIADHGLARGRLDEDAARQALDFFQTFADGCHHGKEECHLFPLMEAKGFPRQGGPTGVMLNEHEQGRRHIRAMHEALPGAGSGQDTSLQEFARHARAYVELIRLHILKEDQRLFPMANQVFTPEDQASLLDRFAHVEQHDMPEGAHERYLQLADSLAERLHVARGIGTACGCGHGESASTDRR